MREIKFRGFYNNKMYYPDATDEYKNAIFHCFSEVAKSDKEKSECAIMQFTGIKDREKTEVYDGDIFGEPIVGLEDEYTGYVKYDEDIGGFVVVLPNGGWECLGFFVTLPNHSRSKVIGNIYENPELLQTIS